MLGTPSRGIQAVNISRWAVEEITQTYAGETFEEKTAREHKKMKRGIF